MPSDVLYALAAAESGQRLATGRHRPWPWTLNVAGNPERHATFEAALASLQGHLAAGHRNIDIGLMQVNWYWHSERFTRPAEALEPFTNLRTGAAILREHYEASGDWLEAAGRYHAPVHASAAATHRERVRGHLEALR